MVKVNHSSLSGTTCMAIGSVFGALMGALLYLGHHTGAPFSAIVSSFIRVLMNCLFVVTLCFYRKDFRSLWGDARPSLWLWGIAGAATVISYFCSVKLIGVGEATFLYTSYAIFITVMGPWVAKESHSVWVWFAVLGASFGYYLMKSPQMNHEMALGKTLGLTSGFFAAIAYLFVRRIGMTNSALTIMAYWCAACLLVHLFIFLLVPLDWPSEPMQWLAILLAGIFATLAQLFTAMAFQRGPAAPVAAVSYLAPVLGTFIDCLFFGLILLPKGYLGIALVLCFGVLLPFLRQKPIRRDTLSI